MNVYVTERNPSRQLELLGFAKKLAHRHAYENAFRRVIIVCLDNGKVAVEINQQDISQWSLDEMSEDGIVQVNYMEEMPHSESDDEREGWRGWNSYALLREPSKNVLAFRCKCQLELLVVWEMKKTNRLAREKREFATKSTWKKEKSAICKIMQYEHILKKFEGNWRLKHFTICSIQRKHTFK